MRMPKRTVTFLTLICIIFMAVAIHAEDLKVRQPTQEEIGKIAICPVMNLKIAVREDTPVIDYKNKSYFFCCSSCVDEFKKDPDKYAK